MSICILLLSLLVLSVPTSFVILLPIGPSNQHSYPTVVSGAKVFASFVSIYVCMFLYLYFTYNIFDSPHSSSLQLVLSTCSLVYLQEIIEVKILT